MRSEVPSLLNTKKCREARKRRLAGERNYFTISTTRDSVITMSTVSPGLS